MCDIYLKYRMTSNKNQRLQCVNRKKFVSYRWNHINCTLKCNMHWFWQWKSQHICLIYCGHKATSQNWKHNLHSTQYICIHNSSQFKCSIHIKRIRKVFFSLKNAMHLVLLRFPLDLSNHSFQHRLRSLFDYKLTHTHTYLHV